MSADIAHDLQSTRDEAAARTLRARAVLALGPLACLGGDAAWYAARDGSDSRGQLTTRVRCERLHGGLPNRMARFDSEYPHQAAQVFR